MNTNNLLKSVAASVGLALASAQAHSTITITVGDAAYGIEYAAGGAVTAQKLFSNNAGTQLVRFVSTADMAAGDAMVVTIGGTAGARLSTAAADSVVVGCSDAGTGLDADPTNDAGYVALGTVTGASGKLTGTTITIDSLANACANGKVVTLAGAALTTASLTTAGTINASVSVTRVGNPLTSNATPINVASVVRELDVSIAAAADALNGVVDSRANSKYFTAAGETDVLTLTITNRDVVGATDSTGSLGDALVVTLSGDFSFLDDDATAGCTNADLTNGEGRAAANNNGVVELLDCSNMRVTWASADIGLNGAGGADITRTLTFDVDGGGDNAATDIARFLRAQTFSGTATLKYSSAGTVAPVTRSPSIAPGAFTQSGVTVFVPYMPAGSNISQTLYLTNRSNVVGTVTVSSVNDRGQTCSTTNHGGSLAVAANGITNIGSLISAGLANCYGGAGVTQKLALTISASVPDTTLEVYSGFNIGGTDRATVINSSNGRYETTGDVGSGNSSK